MEHVKIKDNLSFSRIAHGYWRLLKWDLSKQEILNLLETCLEMGITTIDHADIYGDYSCEKHFGEILSQNKALRQKLQIITKCGIKLISKNRPEHKIKHYDTSAKHIISSAENSLKCLKTDYIDVLLIHRPSPFMDPHEIAEAFDTLKEQGKVLNFGVSNFKPSQFSLLSSYLDFPLVTNQIEISPLCLEHFDWGTIEQCQQYRIPPMAWSPLAGGKVFSCCDEKSTRICKTLEKIKKELNADSIEQIVYAWLLSHPAKIIPIVGSGNIDRIKLAVGALKLKMSTQQWFEIWQSATGREVD